MKRIGYYADGNRSGGILHIETDGCVVEITVGRHDNDGNLITVIEVNPDDERRGGDGASRIWHIENATGENDIRGGVVRVVRQPSPHDS